MISKNSQSKKKNSRVNKHSKSISQYKKNKVSRLKKFKAVQQRKPSYESQKYSKKIGGNGDDDDKKLSNKLIFDIEELNNTERDKYKKYLDIKKIRNKLRIENDNIEEELYKIIDDLENDNYLKLHESYNIKSQELKSATDLCTNIYDEILEIKNIILDKNKEIFKILTKTKPFCIQNYDTCYANVMYCLLWDIGEIRDLILSLDDDKIENLEIINETEYNNISSLTDEVNLYIKYCKNEVVKIKTEEDVEINLSGEQFNKILIKVLTEFFKKILNYDYNIIKLEDFTIKTLYNKELYNITYNDIFLTLRGCSEVNLFKREMIGYYDYIFLYKIITRLRCFKIFNKLFKDIFVVNEKNKHSNINYYYFTIEFDEYCTNDIYYMKNTIPLILEKCKN